MELEGSTTRTLVPQWIYPDMSNYKYLASNVYRRRVY